MKKKIYSELLSMNPRAANRNKAQARKQSIAISRVQSLRFQREKNTLPSGNRNEHKSRTAGRNGERFVGRRVRWIEQQPAYSTERPFAHSKPVPSQSVNLFATLCRIFFYSAVINTRNESYFIIFLLKYLRIYLLFCQDQYSK